MKRMKDLKVLLYLLHAFLLKYLIKKLLDSYKSKVAPGGLASLTS
jgi:hypothetical protein